MGITGFSYLPDRSQLSGEATAENGTPTMGHMGVPKIHAVGPELGFK
jgi:hypothetical protein